jgi:hypothetical protein
MHPLENRKEYQLDLADRSCVPFARCNPRNMENKKKTAKEKDKLLGAAALPLNNNIKATVRQSPLRDNVPHYRPAKRSSVIRQTVRVKPDVEALPAVTFKVAVHNQPLKTVAVPQTADQYEIERLFKQQIQYLIQEAPPTAVLYISTLKPFKKRENRALLEYLAKKEVRFIFEDHNGLTDSKHLKAIVDFLNWESTNKSSRNTTNLKLGLDETIEKSRKKKKYIAYFDEANRVARFLIHRLHQKGLSLHNIAQRLNEAHITTTRANQFHAKQVSRLLESYHELNLLFNAQIREKAVVLGDDAPQRKIEILPMPVGFLSGEILSFDKIITIPFRQNMGAPVRMQLVDHQGGIVFEKTYDQVDTSNPLLLDVAGEDALIYPGRYQMYLFAEGYLPIDSTLEIGRYLIEPDAELEKILDSMLNES